MLPFSNKVMTQFNITKPYLYESLSRVTADTGERLYNTPTGDLPSVTTILSATADKSGLAAWRSFVGDKKADQIRDEATGLGTLIHEHLENHMQGIPRPGGSNLIRKMATNMSNQIIEYGLPNIDEIWGIESPLYMPGRYAGTADLIAVHKGRPAICDFKTASKMRTEDMIGDYFLQLVAYSLAHNKLHGTDINTGVIFMVSRDLQFKEFILEGDKFKEKVDEWWARVEAFEKIINS